MWTVLLLKEEYLDGGVYPIRIVRRRVTLNAEVRSEKVFLYLRKRLAREGLEQLHRERPRYVHKNVLKSAGSMILTCKLTAHLCFAKQRHVVYNHASRFVALRSVYGHTEQCADVGAMSVLTRVKARCTSVPDQSLQTHLAQSHVVEELIYNVFVTFTT